MQRETDFNDQKQNRKRKHQQNKNNLKAKIGRKTIVWTFQEISHMTKLEYGLEKEALRDNSTKQRHNDYVKAKNIQIATK